MMAKTKNGLQNDDVAPISIRPANDKRHTSYYSVWHDAFHSFIHPSKPADRQNYTILNSREKFKHMQLCQSYKPIPCSWNRNTINKKNYIENRKLKDIFLRIVLSFVHFFPPFYYFYLFFGAPISIFIHAYNFEKPQPAIDKTDVNTPNNQIRAYSSTERKRNQYSICIEAIRTKRGSKTHRETHWRKKTTSI